jgi:ribosome-binding factor A
MTSRRVLKAAEAIREVVSMAILTELRDPRISDVTVTFVEVSADMRHAKIHVSIMGDEAKQNLVVKGLQNSAGFLQQKIANRIDTRYTPRIRFVLDHGVKNSIQVARILEDVLPSETPEEDPSSSLPIADDEQPPPDGEET